MLLAKQILEFGKVVSLPKVMVSCSTEQLTDVPSPYKRDCLELAVAGKFSKEELAAESKEGKFLQLEEVAQLLSRTQKTKLPVSMRILNGCGGVPKVETSKRKVSGFVISGYQWGWLCLKEFLTDLQGSNQSRR